MPPCCGLKAVLLTLLGQPGSYRDLFNPRFTDLVSTEGVSFISRGKSLCS